MNNTSDKDETKTLANLLQPLVFSYKMRKTLKNLLGKMISHVESCSLESLLRFKKMEKIKRILNLFKKFSNIPLQMHLFLIRYLENCWENLVMENGFINIHETLNHLNLDIVLDRVKNTQEKSLMRLSDYFQTYAYNIRPLNCQITEKKNERNQISLCAVRPGLSELDGKLYGLCVEIEQSEYTMRIFGLIDSDNLRLYRKQLPLQYLYDDLQKKYNFEKGEMELYVNSISYRDLLVNDIRNLTNRVKHFRDKYDFYCDAEFSTVSGEYQFLTAAMKVDFISFLLEVGLVDLANYLYGKKSFPEKYLDWELQKKINIFSCPSPKKKAETTFEKLPYEIQISGMKAEDRIKAKAYEKLKSMNSSPDGAPKSQKYLDGILKIPFGIIKSEPDLDDPGKKLFEEFTTKFPKINTNELGANYIKIFDKFSKLENTDHENEEVSEFCSDAHFKMQRAREKQQDYLKKVQEIFEKCVHGHDLVKIQLKRLLAQWISGGQSGIVLGLEGPPGNGKTTLIKSGLAKCLVDHQSKPRPVGFIPLGGSSNASTLVGHGFTYQGSTWGRIVDILMECQCMNPIFLFDELDKVSHTEHGREIISILTHLTDTTQNYEFYDKYFEGVPLDVSKALMIFTFNDRSKIDPILLDRMTIIETKPLMLEDKLIVAKDHLIPQITKLVDLEPGEISIGMNELEELICDYTCEAGARQLKKLLESLIQELNLRRLSNPDTRLVVDRVLIQDVFRHKDKVRRESISEKPIIGQINGMWANALGMGGILPIQVEKTYTSKNLVLTGTQGDTMKESMRCAETIAFNLVSKELPDFNKEDIKFGMHIHCPSTGMPKDGPSAGGAICVAVYSYLCDKYLKQDIAMTGEIDLLGNILPIGGLGPKLNGAKKAGIKIALIPKDNEQQFERLKQEDKNPEDGNFKVVMVQTVEEALQYFL